MYCPSCGSEDQNLNQFCRTCGTDLRTVRTAVEQPGVIRGSQSTAREAIGFAVADKFRALSGAKEMKTFAEDVLPEVEKFLEDPAERRLRRIRFGVITAMLGLGVTIFFGIFSQIEYELLPMIGIGLAGFLVGLGIILNGWWFTISGDDAARERNARLRDLLDAAPASPSLQAASQRFLSSPPSVVENTTRDLKPEYRDE